MQTPPPMSVEDYRAARIRSGISVSDIWCAATRITRDQDKSYASGRTPIPEAVSTRVLSLVESLSNRGRILAEKIGEALPDSTINFDDISGAITLTFPSTKSVQIDCAGVDTMNLAPVYVAGRSTRNETIFIFFGNECPAKPRYIHEEQWFLWRGNFPENRYAGRLQNYYNPIEEPILALAFSAYQ